MPRSDSLTFSVYKVLFYIIILLKSFPFHKHIYENCIILFPKPLEKTLLIINNITGERQALSEDMLTKEQALFP